MQTDPTLEDFRTSKEANVIYAMIGISTFTQCHLAALEVDSFMGSYSIERYFDSQNILDVVAISYNLVYNVLRIIMPSPTYISEEKMTEGSLISL